MELKSVLGKAQSEGRDEDRGLTDVEAEHGGRSCCFPIGEVI